MEFPKIKTHKLRATTAIIDKSVPRHSGKCIGAYTVKEQIPGAYSVEVSAETIRFNVGGDNSRNPHRNNGMPGYRFCYVAPAILAIAADKLDRDHKAEIKPFDFTLDGRTATVAPLQVRGETGLQNPPKKRQFKGRKPSPRRSRVRRYRGIKEVRPA